MRIEASLSVCVTRYVSMSAADELAERLTAYLADQVGRDVEVASLQRLPGGASRESWAFTLDDGQRYVLRRDPPSAPSQTDRRFEVELLRRAARAGVPVPEVVWAPGGDELGSPGFVMRFVDGETIARRILREPDYERAREVMASQCGDILARIHSVPTDGLGLEDSDDPPQAMIDRYTELLDSLGEPHPAFELAFRWLADRKPDPASRCLVHGDFRNGNLIVGPDGVRAVLDWELAHVGDPWEDLAWLCTRSWRFGEPGEVGGFGDRADLYGAYEETSGAPVDVEAVRWWEVASGVKWGVMTILQAFTHIWGHVRSLELAAIGRRTVETEHDVLRLLDGPPDRRIRV